MTTRPNWVLTLWPPAAGSSSAARALAAREILGISIILRLALGAEAEGAGGIVLADGTPEFRAL